ncbi:MAG TPA: hypothetical protein VLH94_00635 [Spirochaetia bacterium]|nr:hypothetical protein [Spirochaetia bacterium]
MAPQEKETISNKAKMQDQEKPFQWGDELVPKGETPESEVDDHSYSSVAELLKIEEEFEKKRLEEYLKSKQ